MKKKNNILSRGLSGALAGVMLMGMVGTGAFAMEPDDQEPPYASVLAQEDETGDETPTETPEPDESEDPEPSPSPEPELPAELAAISVTVKKNAPADTVTEGILSKIKSENPDLPIASVDFGSSKVNASGMVTGTVSYTDGGTASISVDILAVEPTGWEYKSAVSSVYATDAENRTSSTLLSHVNKDRAVIAVGNTDYDNALGTAPTETAPALAWKNCDREYLSSGGVTYKFTADYKGSTLTRTVTVHSVSSDIDVRINYSNNTVNTISGMKWSFSRSFSSSNKWSSCSANMSIPSSWYGMTVFFYMPGNQYASESNVDSLYIPPKADKPEEKLVLTSTTHSITVENCWDFGDVEFSLDKVNWKSTKKEKLTWVDLEPNKSYSVSVRTCADVGDYLASDSVNTSIKTQAPIVTGIEVDQSVKGDYVILNATGTVAPSTSKNMSGSFSPTHFTKLNNALKTAEKKYDDQEIHLVINYYPEVDFGNGSTKLSIPISSIRDLVDAGMDIEYNTEFGSILLSNRELWDICGSNKSGTLVLTTQALSSAPSGSKLSWLKDQYKDGVPIYKMSVKAGSKSYAADFAIPYKLRGNEASFGLNTYQVSASGEKDKLSGNYDQNTGFMTVAADSSDSYYLVLNDGPSRVVELPFYDVDKASWAYDPILYCYNHGIMTGTSEFTFAPNTVISKAQFITMLARMDGVDTSETVPIHHLRDVPATAWYATAAQWAYDTGLCKESTFNGDAPIERQEIASLMHVYMTKISDKKFDIDTKSVAEFGDQKAITSKYRTAALYVKGAGLMTGYGNNNFGPKDMVTREQMAAVAQRMNELLNK